MPSDFEFAILDYEKARLGSPDRVIEHFFDPDRDLRIPVAEFDGSPENGLTSYATIGLSQFDNDFETAANLPMRVEYLATARIDQSYAAIGVAQCANRLQRRVTFAMPGVMLEGAFTEIDPGITTPHALLWYPFQWDATFEGLERDGVQVEWLLVLPITQREADFVAERGGGFRGPGVEALIDLFESTGPDVWDLTRPSAV